MRQNPDVIMVGEMRDLETMDLALQASEMGSLVLATLHTRTVYQTVDRVIDVFPSEQQAQVRMQLATSLTAVVSQTLIPHASGVGRKSAFEIMVCNDAIRNAVREGKPQQIPSLIQAGAHLGMKLMDKALQELVIAREVKYEDVIYKAADPKRFEELVGFYKGM
jgi:twitching motility protein PilT